MSQYSKVFKDDLMYKGTTEAEVIKNFSTALRSSFEVPVLFVVDSLFILLQYIQNTI